MAYQKTCLQTRVTGGLSFGSCLWSNNSGVTFQRCCHLHLLGSLDNYLGMNAIKTCNIQQHWARIDCVESTLGGKLFEKALGDKLLGFLFGDQVLIHEWVMLEAERKKIRKMQTQRSCLLVSVFPRIWRLASFASRILYAARLPSGTGSGKQM